MSFSVENKVVLVTGANRGIGRSIVDEVLKQGASKVYLAVRDLKSVEALVRDGAGKLQPLYMDLSKADSITSAAELAQDVDVLINNAGVLQLSDPLAEGAEEALRFELEVNTFGLLRIAKAFADILEKNKGALVQLNSVASIKNFATATTYSASKAASYSITQGLRDVLKERGVTVVSVHPGPIETDMAASAGLHEGLDSPTVVAKGIVAALTNGDFHAFPDMTAKQFEAAYNSYSEAIILAEA